MGKISIGNASKSSSGLPVVLREQAIEWLSASSYKNKNELKNPKRMKQARQWRDSHKGSDRTIPTNHRRQQRDYRPEISSQY